MNGASLFLAVQASLPAENIPVTTSAIGLQEAALVLLVGAVLFLAKSISELRARIEELAQPRAPSASSAARPDAVRPAPPSIAAAAENSVSPEVLAVIAAAVHVSLEGHARIVAVTPEAADRVWSLEGRRQIFHSHQIR